MYNPRAAYLGQMVATASPAKLLVMLYDRLLLDLARAEEAQQREDYRAAGTDLIHAQEIVLELRSSLRTDVWDGAEDLSGLYGWLHSELVRANTSRDAAATAACRRVVEPLAEAWREAALTAVAG
jgi:flagellar protein FliS